jgi:hypothetical protein
MRLVFPLVLLIFILGNSSAQQLKISSDFRFLKRYITTVEGQMAYNNEKLLYQFTKVEFGYVSPEVLKLYYIRMLANGSVDTLDYRFNIKDITSISIAPILNNNTSQVFVTCLKRTVLFKYRSDLKDENFEGYINTFPIPFLYSRNVFFSKARRSFLALQRKTALKNIQ